MGNAGSVSLFASQALQDPTVKPAVDGSPSLPQASDKDFSVEVVVDPLDPDAAHSAGVLVDHPLLMGNHGTADDHVFFKYAWWDEKDGRADGPRSQSEPDLFSSHQDHRVITGNPSIPISGVSDARTGNDQYMVEIYGYHVVDGTEKLFYKSTPTSSRSVARRIPRRPLIHAIRCRWQPGWPIKRPTRSSTTASPSTARTRRRPTRSRTLPPRPARRSPPKAPPLRGLLRRRLGPRIRSSGPVAADGSLVLKLYYSRNVHQVSWSTDGDPLQGAYTSGPTMFRGPDNRARRADQGRILLRGMEPGPRRVDARLRRLLRRDVDSRREAVSDRSGGRGGRPSWSQCSD